MRQVLHGIIPAILSPCNHRDQFVEDAFGALAAHVYQCGVHGLYVCGATGDAYTLSMTERQRAVEIAVEVSGPFDGQVIVHVGTHDTRSTVQLAEHAAEVGASAVASMPPANRTHGELVDYYTDVAKAAQLPTLIYHIPALTGQDLPLLMFERLLDIPGVAGIKFSDSNLFLLKRLLRIRPEIAMFNGNDELLTPALLYGACGGIGMTYNIFPEFFVRLYETVLAGDIKKAMHMQNRFMAYLDQAITFGGLRPVLNHIMAARGFGPFSYRRPRTLLSQQAAEQFDEKLGPYIRAVEEAGQTNKVMPDTHVQELKT